MNSDFRVSVSLPSHPKAFKLMRRCGDVAFYNLVKFWSYVAQNKPDGILKGLEQDDIEIASGWSGQCSEFYQALLDLCFIEYRDGILVVHDWEDHNGYACHAKQRSLKAKRAAEARWGKENHATSNTQAILNHATSNAPSPAPTPTPVIKKKIVKKKKAPAKAKPVAKNPPAQDEVKAFFLKKRWPADEAIRFFEYYDTTGWRRKDNTPVYSWKGQAVTWMSFKQSKANGNGEPTRFEFPKCRACGQMADNIIRGVACPFCGGKA
jgi:hypothetical protein